MSLMGFRGQAAANKDNYPLRGFKGGDRKVFPVRVAAEAIYVRPNLSTTGNHVMLAFEYDFSGASADMQIHHLKKKKAYYTMWMP